MVVAWLKQVGETVPTEAFISGLKLFWIDEIIANDKACLTEA